MTHQPLPQTPEEVASAAMLLLGFRPMQSFTELDRAEVVTCTALYELCVSEVSEAHPWKFCEGQQVLENDPTPPLDRYETAWHIPKFPTSTPFYINTVRVGGQPIHYEIMGDRIYADCGADEGPIAQYTYRVNEAFWPPSFKMCIVFRLAQMLAHAITRKKEQIDAMNGAYEVQVGRSKFRDAKSVTVKRMDQTRFLRNRRMVSQR